MNSSPARKSYRKPAAQAGPRSAPRSVGSRQNRNDLPPRNCAAGQTTTELAHPFSQCSSETIRKAAAVTRFRDADYLENELRRRLLENPRMRPNRSGWRPTGMRGPTADLARSTIFARVSRAMSPTRPKYETVTLRSSDVVGVWIMKAAAAGLGRPTRRSKTGGQVLG